MPNHRIAVRVRPVTSPNARAGKLFAGLVFTGQGMDVVRAIWQETGLTEASVLEMIVKELLVEKGVDWTGPILSEYLGLYEDSLGTFALVWDRQAKQLVAHGAVFQSAANPGAGLIAHIRTAGAAQGLGLGTLVTEEVTRAAFDQGARIIALATDDKRHRLQHGEKAAHTMYSRIGYAIFAEKHLADTIDWLMVIDPHIFEHCQRTREGNDGRFPAETSVDVRNLQAALVSQARAPLSGRLENGRIEPVRDGDMANLFLLMNLSPPDDFQFKLSAWAIHMGPEFERSWVVNVRPAIMDRDRLEDASLVLRDQHGAVVAVCAARQATPFTRNAIHVDFYCLPEFLAKNKSAVENLVAATLDHVRQSTERPEPCRLLFSGVDAGKLALFNELGFVRNANTCPCFAADGKMLFAAQEFELQV